MSQPVKDDLEVRITRAGQRLLDGFQHAMNELPEASAGPQRLATRLGVDKVLASRLLKALRTPDPLAVIHRMPGPDPLRRVAASLEQAGVSAAHVAEVSAAIEGYDEVIKRDAGDISGLQAILSAWVPEAKRDFEGRRLQAMYRAVSQLKGASVDVYADTVFFTPSPDGETIDVVWIKALVNLVRLRPGAVVKLTSHRAVEEDGASRAPKALDGSPITDLSASLLSKFCSPVTPRISVRLAGEQMHYILEDDVFGSHASATIVTCETNTGELPRYVDPAKNRLAWASSEPSVPAKLMQFDCFVHEDLWGGSAPGVRVYDTAIGGIADVNDPAREIDRLDVSAVCESLGRGLGRARSDAVPDYHAMVEHVRAARGWDPAPYLGYRVVQEHPLYGSQTALTFRTVGRG